MQAMLEVEYQGMQEVCYHGNGYDKATVMNDGPTGRTAHGCDSRSEHSQPLSGGGLFMAGHGCIAFSTLVRGRSEAWEAGHESPLKEESVLSEGLCHPDERCRRRLIIVRRLVGRPVGCTDHLDGDWSEHIGHSVDFLMRVDTPPSQVGAHHLMLKCVNKRDPVVPDSYCIGSI
ncbi:uncharacterized protein UBRO_20040 [Ustilago bromivora]|uniref:Uncharacterized protein n=1 Tax=Ustilago bromivora TaxID=307758 RepID=A0A1K0H370_9BASI|nr:uncharacterized protein UBRO_20040 [Ustilago bromivora]